MKEILEILTTIFISFIFASLLFTAGKLNLAKSKAIKEMLSRTGERFEIFLRTKCIFSDTEVKIRTPTREYTCGRGEIR